MPCGIFFIDFTVCGREFNNSNERFFGACCCLMNKPGRILLHNNMIIEAVVSWCYMLTKVGNDLKQEEVCCTIYSMHVRRSY